MRKFLIDIDGIEYMVVASYQNFDIEIESITVSGYPAEANLLDDPDLYEAVLVKIKKREYL